MAAHDVLRVIVGNPSFAVGVFPYQRLERQVDTREGIFHHQGRSAFRVAEDQQLFRTHDETGARRICAEIDAREYR